MLTTPAGSFPAGLASGIAASDAEAMRNAMMKMGRDFRMVFFSFRFSVCCRLTGYAFAAETTPEGCRSGSLGTISGSLTPSLPPPFAADTLQADRHAAAGTKWLERWELGARRHARDVTNVVIGGKRAKVFDRFRGVEVERFRGGEVQRTTGSV